MNRVAFLGLGRMGAAMATRLAQSGVDISAWNRTAGRGEAAAAAGAVIAKTPQSAVAGRDLIITMLSDERAVAEVVGRLAAEPGATVIEMSTISPDAVRQVRSMLPAEVGLIDAPVLGGVAQAATGTLHIFAGGEPHVVDRCEPVLSQLGTVQRCGALGSGAAVKLVVNLANISSMVVLGEALRLAGALGVDPDTAFGALARTALGSLAQGMRSRIETACVPVMFRTALAEESARLIASADGPADSVAMAVHLQLRSAIEAGLADQDVSAAIRKMAGS
jgi:3-hydroxyisobutyrate dehydrogenase-like beta-hydroxyacid dehydrogenase